LIGGPQSPSRPADRNVYAVLVESGKVDVLLTYCTNAQQAVAEQPSLRSVRLPDPLRVGAVYGLVVRRDAPKSAVAFAAYLISAGVSASSRTSGSIGCEHGDMPFMLCAAIRSHGVARARADADHRRHRPTLTVPDPSARSTRRATASVFVLALAPEKLARLDACTAHR
jgi:hypothetical protein